MLITGERRTTKKKKSYERSPPGSTCLITMERPFQVRALASFVHLTTGPRPVISAAGPSALSFLCMKHDAQRLRLVCRTLRESVAEHRWSDDPLISNVERWHASFPNAYVANLHNQELKDADVFALAQVETLILSHGVAPATFFDQPYTNLFKLDLS